MPTVTESTHNLRRNLREIAEHQNFSARVGEYLDSYFVDVELNAASDASPEELLGAATQHFRLGEVRPARAAVSVLYTPDFDRHGWHSPHTVIDVVTDDMPFLVDSITMVVYRRGLVIHRLLHPLISAERDAEGKLLRTLPRGAAGSQPESWIHLEIDRIGDTDLIADLHREIVDVLADVRAAVEDGATMQQRMHEADVEMAAATAEACDEVAAYLRWIAVNNFVFLGYAEYRAASGSRSLTRVAESGLGILRYPDHPRFGTCLAGIPGVVAELARDPLPAILVKADARLTMLPLASSAMTRAAALSVYGLSSACTPRTFTMWRQPTYLYCGARLPPSDRMSASCRAATVTRPCSMSSKPIPATN